MKQCFLILLTTTIFSSILSGQSSYDLDSLLEANQVETSDTAQLNFLLSYAVQTNNYDLAHQSVDKALLLSENTPASFRFKALLTSAKVLYFQTKYYDAIKVLETISESKKLLTFDQLIELYLQLSECHVRSGGLARSLEYSSTILNIADSLDNQYLKAQSYDQMGKVYYAMRELQSCLYHYRKAIKIYKKEGSESDMASMYNGIGIVLAQIEQQDSALYYYQLALPIRIKNNNHYQTALLYNNMAVIFEDKKQLLKARDYYLMAFEINNKVANQTQKPLYLLNIGNIYGLLEAYDSGQYYLEQSIAETKKSGNLELKTIAYQFLSDLYEHKGDFKKAYATKILHAESMRALLQESKVRSLQDIESKYKLEQSQTENRLLIQESELAKEKQIRQNAVIISVSGGLLSTLLIIGILYRNTNKKNQTNLLLSKLNKEIYLQNTALTEQKEEIETQANELSSANHEIQTINQNLEKIVQTRTVQLEKTNKELQTFLYRASHDLKGPLASIQGLAHLANKEIKDEHLRDYIQRLYDTSKEMDLTLRKLMALNTLSETMESPEEIHFEKLIFDSVAPYQEVLDKNKIAILLEIDTINNFYSFPFILKTICSQLLDNCIHFCQPYEGASRKIKITISENNQHVLLNVWDNGVGIAPEVMPNIFKMFYRGNETSSGNGLGLYIVQNSVNKLKGEIEIDSKINEYTTITVVLPK